MEKQVFVDETVGAAVFNLKNFKSVGITGKNLDELYFRAVGGLIKYGRVNEIDSGSYAGLNRLEFDNITLIIENPIPVVAPNPRPGIPVTTSIEDINNYFVEYLMNGIPEENEHYKYSSWIVGIPEKRSNKKSIKLYEKEIPRGTRLNQLEWCIDHFKKKGFGTNHCYITIGCAEGLQRYDWPYKDETDRGTTECLRGFSLNIRDKKYLDLNCLFRSWDLINALPENLGGLSLLMEYVASALDLEPNVLIANSPRLHCYSHSRDYAADYVAIEPNKIKEF